MSLLYAMMGGAPAGAPKPAYPYTFPTSAPYNVPYYAVTPTDDGTGSSMHPSGLDFGKKGWGGHRYWLATTAFFNSEEPRENPHIYHSDDAFVWSWPEGVTNPMDPWPGAGTTERWYNSDTNLVHNPETNELVLTWRECRHTRNLQTIWARTSRDGHTWTPKVKVMDVLDDTKWQSASQSLVRVGPSEWRMYFEASSDIAYRRYFTASSPLGPYSNPQQVTYTGQGGVWPYHGEVIRHPDGRYLSLFQRAGKEYPAISTDGITFATKPPILQSVTLARADQAMYKSSLALDAEDPGMVHVWYTANGTWNNHVYYTRVPLSAWEG